MTTEDEKRRIRRVEWNRFEIFPGGEAACIIEGCTYKGRDCRETPEGVLCLHHYEILPECERMVVVDGKRRKCCKPSVMGLGYKNQKHAPPVLCREHYCGAITDEYLEESRRRCIGLGSSLRGVQDEENLGNTALLRRSIDKGAAKAMSRKHVRSEEGEW
jgi:hypothetical protein